MGAHSLGGAKPENSGYKGKWTGPANAGFSEIYYKNMISNLIQWKNVVSINISTFLYFNTLYMIMNTL
jgi:hypothetical protein